MATMNGISGERLRQFARMGAEVTLKKLREEVLTIERAFPELAMRPKAAPRVVRKRSVTTAPNVAQPAIARNHSATTRPKAVPVPKRGRRQSEATRKGIAAGMKRYWAERRMTAAAAPNRT